MSHDVSNLLASKDFHFSNISLPKNISNLLGDDSNLINTSKTSVPNFEQILFEHNYCKSKNKSFLSLKLLSLNVCGLFSKIKFGTLSKHISEFDICCLSEIKTEFIPDDQFENYKCFVFDKKLKNSSNRTPGIATIIKENVFDHIVPIKNTLSHWVFWMEIGIEKSHPMFILGNVYIPCESSPFFHEDIFDEILQDILSIQTKSDLPFILLGDFNSRTGIEKDFFESNPIIDASLGTEDDFSSRLRDLGLLNRFNFDKKVNKNGENLLELCRACDLKIVNGRFGKDQNMGAFTCHRVNGSSTIDYAIVSDMLTPYINDFSIDIHDRSMSDVHSPIALNIGTTFSKPQSHNFESGQLSSKKIKIYKKKWKEGVGPDFQENFQISGVENLNKNIENIKISGANQKNINDLTNLLSDLFIKTAQKVGLYKEGGGKKREYSRTNPQQPWFDSECEAKRNLFFTSRQNLRNSHENKRELKEKLDNDFSEYKKFLSIKRNNFQKEFHSRLKELRAQNPKEFWKLINGAIYSNKKTGNISIQEFKAHFENLSNEGSTSDTFNTSLLFNNSSNCDLNTEFTVSELKKMIKKLKNGKACGIDNLSNEFFKNCPESVLLIIVELFNIVFNTGIVPDDWCVGFIQPLFKNKGSINDPDNYRGITLLSCLGKLFTSCLHHRATVFAEKNKTIGEEQAGFREGYDTVGHAFLLNSIIELYKSLNKRLYCAFIDYKKAFDLVDRSSLWQKLLNEKFDGKFIRVVYSLYSKAKSCVKNGGEISDFFNCEVGVRQGENLSPLLFAIYLNDFKKHLASQYDGLEYLHQLSVDTLNDLTIFLKLYVLLYADDTVLLAESESSLQTALTAAEAYCKEWKLNVNLTKTKIVIFSKGKVTKHQDFTFNGELVEVVGEYLYLGVLFNYNGSFDKAIKHNIDKARRAMFGLLTKAGRLLLTIDIILELFDKTVLPVLLYGCEVWGHKNIQAIEIFYRKFLKMILKLNTSTSSIKLYGEVGKLPLETFIKKRIISYWIKVSESKPTKYSSIMYNMMFKLQSANNISFSWCTYVKNILFATNFQDLWVEQEKYDTKKPFKKAIFKAIDSNALLDWSQDLFSSPKCLNYRCFKVSHQLESYISDDRLTTVQKIALCQFRCGSNRIPVNNFSFSNDFNEKLCPICKNGQLGDEFHYIFECNKFRIQRRRYLHKYYWDFPSTLKLEQLFNDSSRKNVVGLAKFCHEINDFFSKIWDINPWEYHILVKPTSPE